MAKKGSGLTTAQRPNGSWRAQIRKAGFPYESRNFLSHTIAPEPHEALRMMERARDAQPILETVNVDPA